MPARWTLRWDRGWPPGCKLAARGLGLDGGSGGRWRWTARRCAAPGNGPQVMATLRNLGTGILKLSGYHNIAAACRLRARDATRTLAMPGLTSA